MYIQTAYMRVYSLCISQELYEMRCTFIWDQVLRNQIKALDEILSLLYVTVTVDNLIVES